MSNNIDIPIWLVPIVAAVIAGGPIAMGKYIFRSEEKRIDNLDKNVNAMPKIDWR